MITNDRRVVFDVVARVAATAVAARVVDCVSAACIVVECAARARAIHGDERGGDRDVRGVYRYTVPAFESVLTPSIDTYIHRRDGQRSRARDRIARGASRVLLSMFNTYSSDFYGDAFFRTVRQV
jgi:hypothetical protein